MGTPPFAVASLDVLLQAGCQIVGVVTAPDKPAGRGMQMHQSAVKQFALEHALPILQPVKLKDPAFLQSLKEWQADLFVVVAFRMLPESVWNMPPLGSINLHGSLLPKYRGAAPINWAVINGEKETGVTTFKLKHEIDTGNILLQESFPIGPDETAGEIHDRMMHVGAEVLLRTVKGIAEGTIHEKEQPRLPDTELLPHAPKIFTETCVIDFNQPAQKVHDLVRGLSPFPGAYTQLNGKACKVFRCKVSHCDQGIGLAAGDTHTDKKTFLHFRCADECIAATEIQLEGKKKMDIEAFLRGYRFE
jgi:methionyl-tRNA formyltransferase